MPALSVVIPAYNVARFITAAVESALAQTMGDLEVIVVDDGSTDGTAALIRSISDPRVTLVSKPNGGLSSARNAGVRVAGGRYLGFLDGDDIWFPEKAEKQIAALEAERGITMTYSHSAYLAEDGIPTGAILASRVLRPSITQLVRRNLVGNGSTPIGRTADFIAAGPFDESLSTVADYEMWPRLMHRTGRGLLLIPEALTGYRIRAASLSMSQAEFVADAVRADRLIRERMPQVPAAVRRTGIAETCRIAARKLASGGQRVESLRYLAKSVGYAPWLPFGNARFWGTALIAVSGGQGEGLLHQIADGATSIARRAK
jgi:glycosyltransferase involved in cell wall biosynthesis